MNVRGDRARQRMIDARKAAREGKRFYAFYRGCHDARAGRATNPYPPDSGEAVWWTNGWKYAKEPV